MQRRLEDLEHDNYYSRSDMFAEIEEQLSSNGSQGEEEEPHWNWMDGGFIHPVEIAVDKAATWRVWRAEEGRRTLFSRFGLDLIGICWILDLQNHLDAAAIKRRRQRQEFQRQYSKKSVQVLMEEAVRSSLLFPVEVALRKRNSCLGLFGFVEIGRVPRVGALAAQFGGCSIGIPSSTPLFCVWLPGGL